MNAHRIHYLAALLLVVAAVMYQPAFSEPALIWDPSSSSQTEGYRLYLAPTPVTVAPTPIDVGPFTYFDLAGYVTPGVEYEAWVTAYAQGYMDSGETNHLIFTPSVTEQLEAPGNLQFVPIATGVTETFDFVGPVEDRPEWQGISSVGSVVAADGSFAVMPDDTYHRWHLIHQTASSGADQCVILRLGSATYQHATNGYGGFGAMLRVATPDGAGSGYMLASKSRNANGSLWFTVETYDGVSFLEATQGSVEVQDVDDGDYTAYAVSGVGTGTVFSYWDLGPSDPGGCGALGAPTAEIQGGLTVPVDTGNYLGIYLGSALSDSYAIDEFRSGVR